MKKKFIDEIYKMLQIKLLRKYLEDLQQIKSMKNKKKPNILDKNGKFISMKNHGSIGYLKKIW